MALIGSIAVNVVANTQKFSRGITDARKQVGGFASAAMSAATSMKGMVIGLAAAAAGAVTISATLRAIEDTLERVDELAKDARRIGMPVRELQAFQYAAQLSGVSVEIMTKSLALLSARTSEAASGIGEAKDVLRELGIDAERLNRVNPAKQMYFIADAMKQFARSEQIRMSRKIFGEEGGVELLTLLDGGAKGLEQMRTEFMKTGAAIRDADAKKLEEFNDAMLRLKTTAGGAFQNFVIDITPLAIKAINSLQSFYERTGGFEGLRRGARYAVDFAAGAVQGTSSGQNATMLFRISQQQLHVLQQINSGVHKPPVVLQGAGL